MTASGSRAIALMGGIALLERAMSYTLGSLLLVTPAAMGNPTPCRAWRLCALLLHMNDSLLALHEAIAAGQVRLDPPVDFCDPAGDYGDPTGNPVATLRNRACAMMGAWANVGEPKNIPIANRTLSLPIVAAAGAVEITVHGWDVAQACGQDRPIPPALAEELLELCPLFVSDADRPTRFAAPADVPPLASPSDRLVAFLGRQPLG